ncbi:hypothetical protein PG993_009659 [Apiospora rasikravindrae]|uniref:Uncharacterized protein n=1 Tax=Apiospora rasikravindrae TaxID=990691 RepID=A0ABR1SK21_9PEZI
MASSTSGGGSLNDSSVLDDGFANKPWPKVARQKQAEIEHRFFEPGATIRFDQLPPSRGFIFNILPQSKRSELVVSNVLSAATATNRRLNQSEIDALSESANHAVGRLSWVYPLGLGLAVAAAANGRKTFRFPLYTPKMKNFDHRAFPHRSFATLTGKSATWAWHGIRTAAYFPLTWAASLIFMGSMVRTRLLADLATDQRLSQMKQELVVINQRNSQLRREQREQREQRQGQSPQRSPHGANQLLDAHSADQPSDQNAWTGTPQSQVPADLPPLGSPQRTAGLSGRSGPPPSRQGLQGSYYGGGAQATGTQEQEKRTAFDDDDLFDDDDGSPVAASARRSERQRVQSRASQGDSASSWETVRQQAKKESSPFVKGDRSRDDTLWGRARQDGARTTREASSTPAREDYSYNEADEEKAYAKDQAQKEFDAMLEAERQGHSGSSRWSRGR